MPHRHFFRFLIRYKYEVIFPIAVIEGPIITMVSGFLASLGYLSLVPTFLVVFGGDMASDSLFYVLGRSGRRVLQKIKFIRYPEERIRKLEDHYKTHPRKTLAVAKASYGVGSLFMLSAGAARLSFGKFLEYISVPNALRSLILLLIGYYLGRAVRHAGTWLEYYAIAVIILIPLGYYLYRFLKQRRAKHHDGRETRQNKEHTIA